jgi:mono/diheme cytochrome c family protein
MEMNLRRAVKGSMVWLGLSIGLAASMLARDAKAADTNQLGQETKGATTSPADRGRHLFTHNCAHCHGDDARGDEGPSLYDLAKSDKRLTKLITEGIKGEMPKFGEKFSESDVRDLISFLRTLKAAN